MELALDVAFRDELDLVVTVSLFFWILIGKVREMAIDGTATIRINKKEFFIKLFRLHLYNYYNGRKF